MEYIYSTKDAIETPIIYNESIYGGIDFIKAYGANRENALNHSVLKINKHNKIDLNSCDVMNEIYKNIQKISDIDLLYRYINTECIQGLQVISTEKVLKYILLKLFEDKNNCNDLFISVCTNHFLKRYEVTKKLFDIYSNGFKNKSGAYLNIENYLYLSIILSIFFNNSKNLKYLNIILKINDMLCGYQNFNNFNQLLMLFASITNETNCIKHLYSKNGFEI